MSEEEQFVPGGLIGVIFQGKSADKIDKISPWMFVNMQKWLEKKPTGSATFIIEINANQGGVGKISTEFTVKESI